MVRFPAFATIQECFVYSGCLLPMEDVLGEASADACESAPKRLSSERELNALRRENKLLRWRLTHADQHLRDLEALTRDLPPSIDPLTCLRDLKLRMALLLEAGGMLMMRATRCEQLAMHDDPRQAIVAAPNRVREALAAPLALVGESSAGHIVTLPPGAVRSSVPVSALLARLDWPARGAGVLVFLRRVDVGGFDAEAALALEAMLAHCLHVQRSAQAVANLRAASLETVALLANVIETRDQYTRGHSERVGLLALLLGRALRLPDAELRDLEWAGMLHDVGKIGISGSILNKSEPLSHAEMSRIRQHPRIGFEIMYSVSTLAPILPAVLHHHERFDGTGYPDGLHGTEIPRMARIVQIADVFDALTSDRPYRARLSYDDAVLELQRGAGTLTDPDLTALFLSELAALKHNDPARFRHLIAAE